MFPWTTDIFKFSMKIQGPTLIIFANFPCNFTRFVSRKTDDCWTFLENKQNFSLNISYRDLNFKRQLPKLYQCLNKIQF